MLDSAITLIAARRRSKDPRLPLLVAVDGGGGAGKSTLAASLASSFEQLVIVHVDDFYRPMHDDIRRGLTPEAAYASLFDWQRLETDVAIHCPRVDRLGTNGMTGRPVTCFPSRSRSRRRGSS